MQGYEIKFSIYADSETEAQQARDIIVAFITLHARQGRAVTGKKIAEALRKWDSNPLIKREIIKYLS